MNEVEDALSSKALASTELPSGELTKTRQVINSELDVSFTAVLVTIVLLARLAAAGVELTLGGGGTDTIVGFSETGVEFT